VCGLIHEVLHAFSQKYCAWYDIPADSFFNPGISQLPFGLILKWNDRTSLDEVAAMKLARAAGMPVPFVLSCGDHPSDFRRFSFLMTRLPGYDLFNNSDSLNLETEEPWLSQLNTCLEAMRKWESPHGHRICSVLGSTICSIRVPDRKMGPFETEAEMFDYLFSPTSSNGFPSKKEFEKTVRLANEIRSIPHRVVFTHGDFKAHNIMVGDDNSLTGFIDWESGGWYPEYWDYSTATRFARDSWWYQAAIHLGGSRYRKEIECDRLLNNLTVDSYIGM
jgi:aminoglycoside phosphotransferase